MLSVNEDAEILTRLGVLTANPDSPHKIMQNEKTTSGVNNQNLKADRCYSSTDDEENDLNVVYVKQRLLGNMQQQHATGIRWDSNGMIFRIVLLMASFISLGISTSVQGITLPNIAVNTHANILPFIVYVLCFTALGFLTGCATVNQLFIRLNPMLLLLFSVFGTIIFTALLGCSRTPFTVYIYSFILSFFHGTVFRGGLIILHGSNFGTRTLFALHASFAVGALIISLLSAFFLSGTAVPYLHFDQSSSNHHNMLNYLLIKREANLSSVRPPDDDLLMRNSTSKKQTTTSKPLRPDHVVGVESLAEPKSQENVQKRKEVEERRKTKGGGQSVATGLTEDEKHSRNQSSPVQQNTSSSPQVVTTKEEMLNNRKSTEKPTITNSTSVPHLTTVSTGAATSKTNGFNFTVREIPYSFWKLNWRFETEASSSIWLWKELEQKFGPFQNVDMVYTLTTILGLCCLIPYLVAAACCSSCCVTVPNLQMAKLETASELPTDDRAMTISWRIYSGLFLLLTGGTELIIGETLTFYTLCRPELNFSQRNGILLTSTFWLGICATRIPPIIMAKFVSISRLSNVLLLSAVVAGYIAVNVPSLFAFHCTLFVLGLLLGPLLPSVLCWLDEQQLSNRLSLILLYGIGISLGRLAVPLLITLFITINSTSVVLFAVACGSLFFSYIALIMTIRAVRTVARLSAMNRFMNAVCENGETNAGVTTEQKKTRNGEYVALVDESDGTKYDAFDDEEDDDSDQDFLLDEDESRRYAV